MNSPRYRTIDVPVSGGDLRVGVWDALRPDAPTVVAIHGITSSHLAWRFLADALPGVRIVAPDLRGRGHSNTLSGPAGMAAHADDVAAVFAALEIPPTAVIGHSMGAFVSVVLAHRHPELVTRLLLIDGGLPLAPPPGLDADALVAAILGPTAERLTQRFPDVGAYLDFWRPHPAFAGHWSPELEEYFAYDLVPDETSDAGLLRPATSYATTREDTVDLNTGMALRDAVAQLRVPTTLITVPRGLQNEPPGLYPLEHLRALLDSHAQVSHQRWEDYNHYTVALTSEGAAELAMLVAEQLESDLSGPS